MAIRINKIDKGDIVKIYEDSPNATSYYGLWNKEFPVLEIDEKKKVAIIEHCGEPCMISFDDLKFVKEEDVEMAKRGMMLEDSKKKIEDMSLEEADPYMSIWHIEKANFFFPKDMIYIWFYDHKGAGKKLSSDEYDPMLFPPGHWGQRTPPLMVVWTKGYQKKVRGSENILGIIQGQLRDGDLYIEMMTVKPTYRRNKINSLMVRTLKKEFKPKKVIFVNTTKMGKSFEGSGKYAKGGGVEDSKELNVSFKKLQDVLVEKRGYGLEFKHLKNRERDVMISDIGYSESFGISDIIRQWFIKNGATKEGIGYRARVEDSNYVYIFQYESTLGLNRFTVAKKDKKPLRFNKTSLEFQYGAGGNIEIGDKVKATKAYGGKSGTVIDKRGSFVIVKNNKGETESYHESDLIKRMKMGGGLDEDIYGFHNIPIDVSKKNYDEAISFREKYKLFPNIGIATFLSNPILWRVVDQNEYDIIMRTGKVTGGEFSIKPEREMGPSFTGSRSNAVAFGLAWKKANRLKGQLYLIGINAEDKEFLNLSMVERFEKQGLKYEVGDYDIHSSLGDTTLGFSVRNVSLKDINYIYELSDLGQLKDITYDVITY